MHGVQEIDPDADAPDLRKMLRSTYRFGTSIPHGFRRDAQFEYGRRFDKTPVRLFSEGGVSRVREPRGRLPERFVNPAQ